MENYLEIVDRNTFTIGHEERLFMPKNIFFLKDSL